MDSRYERDFILEEKKLGQLDSWTPIGIAKHIDLERFFSAAMDTNLPPWRPIPSRAAAHIIGTSLQSLANWRMRDCGPRTEPMKKGYGNRIFYRPDRLAEWLSGGRCADWEFSACWLEIKGIPVDVMDVRSVQDRINWMEDLNVFPPVHCLWRRFRDADAT